MVKSNVDGFKLGIRTTILHCFEFYREFRELSNCFSKNDFSSQVQTTNCYNFFNYFILSPIKNVFVYFITNLNECVWTFSANKIYYNSKPKTTNWHCSKIRETEIESLGRSRRWRWRTVKENLKRINVRKLTRVKRNFQVKKTWVCVTSIADVCVWTFSCNVLSHVFYYGQVLKMVATAHICYLKPFTLIYHEGQILGLWDLYSRCLVSQTLCVMLLFPFSIVHRYE